MQQNLQRRSILITKEQAVEISDQIIQEARLVPPKPAKLFRGEGWLDKLGTVTLLSALLLFGHAPNWLCSCLIACSSILYLLALFQSRHPIFEIRHNVLIYRGFWPWEKREFSLREIVKVTLYAKTNWLSSVRMLCIQTDTEVMRVWLISGYRFQVPKLNHFFRANFRQRFINFAD